MSSSPDEPSNSEARDRSLRQTSSHEATSFPHSPLPRRSHSDRVSHQRPSFSLSHDHDLPPLPSSELSSEARRQSIVAMDRKRRLTASAHDTGRRRTTTGGFTNRDNRYYTPAPRRSSQRSGHSGHLGHSDGDHEQREVIDLTSSSPPQVLASRPPEFIRSRRTPSEGSRGYTVPRWQPDSEVSECFICHRPFGFLFRRHHCRKCGRVVCNDCSPHRITIPRQYIVHPPGIDETSPTSPDGTTIDLTRADEEDDDRYAPFGNPHRRSNLALGGGEKVRLCNPCVPDPQPELQAVLREGPPPRLPYPGAADSLRPAIPNLTSFPQPQHLPPRMSDFERLFYERLPHPGTRVNLDDDNDDNDSASSPEVYTSSSRHRSMGLPQNRYMPPPGPQHSRFHSLDSRQAPLPPLPPFASRPRNQSMLDSFSRTYGAPPPFGYQTGMPPRPPHLGQPEASSSTQPSAPRPSRPRVREEDICPICRCLLPPRGPEGDETDRENHIIECISVHDGSNQSPANRQRRHTDGVPQASSLPNPGLSEPPRLQTFGNSGPTLPISTSTTVVNPPPPPPRAAPTQMLRFTATEKDCGPSEGTEGQMQECSICMVEYDVGDKLVRLECWCKFHEECIVEWFGRRAECPVHKLS